MKMRIWWHNNVSGTQNFDVKDEKDALVKYTQLVELDLANEAVTDNMGGCEVFEDGEWSEFYNEEGLDISEIFDEEQS